MRLLARCTRRPRATRSSSRRSSATLARQASRPARAAHRSCSASGCPRASSRYSRGGGRDFEIALLERLVALDEEQFLASLEEALAAGLLLESTGDPGHYSFSHALIRETPYEGMSAHRRARTH